MLTIVKGNKKKALMKKYCYTVILSPQPEGVFTVTVPALPGCITEGRTRAEAVRNAREAIELYIETLIEDGEPLPQDAKPFTEIIHLNLHSFNEPKISLLKS